MEELEPVEYRPVTILDVLGVDLCANAILDRIPFADLARSERVSLRWQRAVRQYLQTGFTLSYEGWCYPNNVRDALTTHHRAIFISNLNHSLPLVRKTLKKWGPCIVRVITDIGEDTYLDIIVSECPNLEQIKIRFQHNERRSAVPLIQITKLKQLKRIVLHHCVRVNDTFFEAVARGCKKLEYLEIRGSLDSVTVRGVKVLCRRSPSVRTTLHFPMCDVLWNEYLEIVVLTNSKHVALDKDLVKMGCSELTMRWFFAACPELL